MDSRVSPSSEPDKEPLTTYTVVATPSAAYSLSCTIGEEQKESDAGLCPLKLHLRAKDSIYHAGSLNLIRPVAICTRMGPTTPSDQRK